METILVGDPLRTIDDSLLVLLARQGDRDAFRRLVDRYDARLLYFVRRILGETDGALDVLQSVWLIVHRKLCRLQSPETFRTWLYRIAHDQAVSEVRRKTRRPILLEDLPALSDESEHQDDETLENAELVHKALVALPVDQRRVLTLRFLEEMSIDEMATVLGCVPGTVKSRLYYAKRALRRRIEEMVNEQSA